MRIRLAFKVRIGAAAILFMAGSAAHAGTAACWSGDTREEITCVKITEQLLLNLRGQTVASVRKTMKVPGVERHAPGLYFLSNYNKGRSSGAGEVTVIFEEGRAIIISASVGSLSRNRATSFVWSAYTAPPLGKEIDRMTKDFARGAFCSDFSGKPTRCGNRDAAAELTLSQMEFGLTKAEVAQLLDALCSSGQDLAVSDPNGECQRLRDRMK